MRNIIITAACFAALPTSAMAATQDNKMYRSYCETESGIRVDVVTQNGKTAVKWPQLDWMPATIELKKEGGKRLVSISQDFKDGFVLILWDFETDRAAVFLRDDSKNVRESFKARCDVVMPN